MPSGWINIEAVSDAQLFDSEKPAFSFLGLTRTQRLYGFVGCTVIGFAISIIGSVLLFVGSLWSFALLYSIGICISLAGTGFLIGFKRQLKMMFSPVRVVATIVFLGSIGLVFVGAFVLHNDALCVVFVVVEYLAYTWYSLSYIPYARTAVKNLLGIA